MGSIPPLPGTPPSESDSRPADAPVTGIIDLTPLRSAEARGQPQAGGRSMKGPTVARGVVSLPAASSTVVPGTPGPSERVPRLRRGTPRRACPRPSLPAQPPTLGSPTCDSSPQCRASITASGSDESAVILRFRRKSEYPRSGLSRSYRRGHSCRCLSRHGALPPKGIRHKIGSLAAARTTRRIPDNRPS